MEFYLIKEKQFLPRQMASPESNPTLLGAFPFYSKILLQPTGKHVNVYRIHPCGSKIELLLAHHRKDPPLISPLNITHFVKYRTNHLQVQLQKYFPSIPESRESTKQPFPQKVRDAVSFVFDICDYTFRETLSYHAFMGTLSVKILVLSIL